MKQFIRHTIAIFFIIAITWSLCGINIVRMSCGLCHETYVLFELFPSEKECPCDGGCCECGHTHEHEDHREHDFFQVDHAFQIEQSQLVAVQIPLLTVLFVSFIDFFQIELKVTQAEKFSFTSPPPDQEVLCIYRC